MASVWCLHRYYASVITTSLARASHSFAPFERLLTRINAINTWQRQYAAGFTYLDYFFADEKGMLREALSNKKDKTLNH